MPYEITQCYLPPGRGDFPAFSPAKAGTRFSDPGGMQGWVDLGRTCVLRVITHLNAYRLLEIVFRLGPCESRYCIVADIWLNTTTVLCLACSTRCPRRLSLTWINERFASIRAVPKKFAPCREWTGRQSIFHHHSSRKSGLLRSPQDPNFWTPTLQNPRAQITACPVKLKGMKYPPGNKMRCVSIIRGEGAADLFF